MTDDEQLALDFLAGIPQENKGVVSHKYLEKGSEMERAAKEALVRLLRGDRPLPHIIRWRMASLFDPEATDERQFSIMNKRRGEQAKPFIALEIARYIAAELPAYGKMDAVQQAATERFSVSLRTVQRAWKEHKDSPLVRVIVQNVN